METYRCQLLIASMKKALLSSRGILFGGDPGFYPSICLMALPNWVFRVMVRNAHTCDEH
jgi:hypothetical protein